MNTLNKNTNGAELKFDWKNYTSLIGLVVLIIASSILSPTFLVPNNILNILKQISAPGCLAIGMTFVILTGGIDLSVGSIMALTGVVIAMTYSAIGLPLAIVLAFLAAILIGIIYGYSITNLNVPPFIVTLAGYSVFRGAALVTTQSAAIPIRSDFFSSLGTYKIPPMVALFFMVLLIVSLVYGVISFRKLNPDKKISFKIAKLGIQILLIAYFAYLIVQVDGLNIQIMIFAVLFILFMFVLNRTVFGRETYAIGGNSEAARLAGIKVKKDITYVYIINALLAATGGLLTAARLSSGTPQVGVGAELDAIAAVVIGGTSLMGGVGRLQGTLIGILLIGVLNNLLSLMGVSADMQMIFKGAIVLGSVVIDTKFKPK